MVLAIKSFQHPMDTLRLFEGMNENSHVPWFMESGVYNMQHDIEQCFQICFIKNSFLQKIYIYKQIKVYIKQIKVGIYCISTLCLALNL